MNFSSHKIGQALRPLLNTISWMSVHGNVLQRILVGVLFAFPMIPLVGLFDLPFVFGWAVYTACAAAGYLWSKRYQNRLHAVKEPQEDVPLLVESDELSELRASAAAEVEDIDRQVLQNWTDLQ